VFFIHTNNFELAAVMILLAIYWYILCDEEIAYITYTVIDGIDGVCWYICMYLYDKSFLNWTSRVGGGGVGTQLIALTVFVCIFVDK
jgi:hypothetical protein